MSSLLMLMAALVPLNGAWQLKGWPTPDRGSVRPWEGHQWLYARTFTLGAVALSGQGVAKIRFADYRRWMGL